MKQIKKRQDLIKAYLDFYESKDHVAIPSASLIPANDPTVLFTTAGMHPLVPYLLGQPHPSGKRLANVQKCIRTQDIDEVGDETHHTFFEMLGNWSLGDYWKKEAIEFTFEFLTKTLKIPLEKLAITCFKGDKNAPRDTEAADIWLSLGIPKERIAFLGKEDNWWGPAGDTGPCGPDTEQFFWSSTEPAPKKFDPKNKHWVEIGNDVLMQYVKDEKGNYHTAKQQTIDFGGGVERTVAVLNGLTDNYQTSIFQPIIKKIEELSKRDYGVSEGVTKDMRIIADHIRAAVFILADGALPSNTEQGYVLRRLIRRAIRYGQSIELENFTAKVAESIFPIYSDYPELKANKKLILQELEKEEERFNKTIEKGLMIFNKKVMKAVEKKRKSLEGKKYVGLDLDKGPIDTISGKEAFLLYQSYGFPIELTKEEAEKRRHMKVDEKGFYKELQKHQTLSRTASSGKFKSGLQDNSEQTTKLHTATHLLNQALREVISPEISQKGSNINPERLRFDFNIDHKLTDEEKTQVEDWVNEKIQEGLKITKEDLDLDEALAQGAQGEFGAKYPPKVSVYTITDGKKTISKEICTGPHVKNTKDIGHFKILKEESVAAGIRRIKATVGEHDK
ncbi:alanine--tRNA ligase [Candidatus Pacearchaeota archaeon]|nr:alanine--tRNA ligase [Candidatus Pacearchaeota archaeon]